MSLPEDAIHDQNVSFLRSRHDSNEERHNSSLRPRDSPWHRISEPSGPGNINGGVANWSHGTSTRTSDRIPIVRRRHPRAADYREPPLQHSQSIYGWAPEVDDEDEYMEEQSGTMLQRMWHSREGGRYTLRSLEPVHGLRRDEQPPRMPRLTSNEHDGRRDISALRDRYGESPLVTAALLQSARRQPRLSGRYRTSSNQPIDHDTRRRVEREEEIQRAFGPIGTQNAHRSSTSNRGELHRASDLRRMYLKDPSVDRLKETIQYLDRVRFSNSYEESLSSAAAGGFVHFDYFLRHEDDFILNTESIAAPAECSWLKPGAVFSGHQQAMHTGSPSMLSHRAAGANRAADPVIINGSEENRITVYTSSGRRYWARNSTDLSPSDLDDIAAPKSQHWPVKVTIHSVDYNTMTLTGTMEAYNIPDKTASNQTAHIITYLEGEIIDFNKHTLETKNFNAGSEIDSCYWRELEPFRDQTYDEMVKSLVSKKWISEQLAKGWILMRWKGESRSPIIASKSWQSS